VVFVMEIDVQIFDIHFVTPFLIHRDESLMMIRI